MVGVVNFNRYQNNFGIDRGIDTWYRAEYFGIVSPTLIFFKKIWSKFHRMIALAVVAGKGGVPKHPSEENLTNDCVSNFWYISYCLLIFSVPSINILSSASLQPVSASQAQHFSSHLNNRNSFVLTGISGLVVGVLGC